MLWLLGSNAFASETRDIPISLHLVVQFTLLTKFSNSALRTALILLA
jgi:hypothetical protein